MLIFKFKLITLAKINEYQTSIELLDKEWRRG